MRNEAFWPGDFGLASQEEISNQFALFFTQTVSSQTLIFSCLLMTQSRPSLTCCCINSSCVSCCCSDWDQQWKVVMKAQCSHYSVNSTSTKHVLKCKKIFWRPTQQQNKFLVSLSDHKQSTVRSFHWHLHCRLQYSLIYCIQQCVYCDWTFTCKLNLGNDRNQNFKNL